VGQAADELRTPDEIKDDIAQTREDMAQTLDAIGDKVSPKLQAQRQAERLRQSGIEPGRLVIGAGAFVTMMSLLILRRRRSRGDGD
jgi:hypothetical protein